MKFGSIFSASWSKLSTFAKCPRKAYYLYVQRYKPPPTEALLRGRGAHYGQEIDNTSKLAGEVLPIGQVLDAAVYAYEEEGGKSVDFFAKEHKAQLDTFEKSGERSQICPVPGTVESHFRIELEVPREEEEKPLTACVEGFVDVLSLNEEGGKSVVDYKTVARPHTLNDVRTDLQFALYAEGACADSVKVVDFVKYVKQHPTTRVIGPVAPASKNKLFTFLTDTIGSFLRCVKDGHWPKCAPTCYWCSPKACEFYDKCYGSESKLKVTKLEPAGTLPTPDWRKKIQGVEPMKLGDMFGSSYLKAADLKKATVVTIEDFKQEKVGQDQEEKWVLYAKEMTKGIVLNKTMGEQLKAIFGDVEDSDELLGKKIEIYVDRTVPFAGKIVGGVRFREAK